MHFIKKKNQENKLIITCIVNILFHVQSFSSMLINQECVCVCTCVCVCGGASTLYLVTLEQINPLITSVHVCCLVCFN